MPPYFSDSDYIVTISKTELTKLPVARFDRKVTVIDHEADVEAAVADLRTSDIIGFDTETKPNFKKGHFNTVALLQLATREKCYLFRLNIIGLHPLLRELLEDPAKIKVGLSIHDDFHNLLRIGELEPAGFIDLQQYVKDFRIADNSLTKIYAAVFGQRISKGQQLTNWEAPHLTPGQQAYAALDALACIRIYDKIHAGEFNPSLSPYYRHPEPTPSAVKSDSPAELEPRSAACPTQEAAGIKPGTAPESGKEATARNKKKVNPKGTPRHHSPRK